MCAPNNADAYGRHRVPGRLLIMHALKVGHAVWNVVVELNIPKILRSEVLNIPTSNVIPKSTNLRCVLQTCSMTYDARVRATHMYTKTSKNSVTGRNPRGK